MSQRNVFVLPAGWSGCAFWRLRLPLAKLQKVGTPLSIDVADNAEKTIALSRIQDASGQADLMVLQAPGNDDATMLMRVYNVMGKKVVIDYDDFSFDLSPGNPRYAELGTKECEILGPDGKVAFRWKDGENGFDLKANLAKYNAFIECIRTADMVTTTTDYLADKFRPHAKRVSICPNSIDFDLWKPIPRPSKYDGQIRIGWFGGDSHLEDLAGLKYLLPKLCKKYPKVRIVLQAARVPQWASVFSDIPGPQMEWNTWADLKHYTLFLAARHWDIGLVPLARNEFGFCKSNIKWLEFSALKVPVIAENCLPYSNSIENGTTGFLADTAEQWYEQACRLIENPGLRKDIAQAAYERALKDYDLAKNCKAWERAYIDCLEESNVNGKIGRLSLCGSS